VAYFTLALDKEQSYSGYAALQKPTTTRPSYQPARSGPYFRRYILTVMQLSKFAM
jgi:hypothetical protein